jgi:hypothetical protein
MRTETACMISFYWLRFRTGFKRPVSPPVPLRRVSATPKKQLTPPSKNDYKYLILLENK